MAFAGAAFDLVKLGVDANKDAKLKQEADELNKTRPKISKDPNAQNNLNLAESDLAQGLSAKSQQAYDDLSNQQFSSGLAGILRGGGDVNSVGNLYNASEEGRQKLAFMRDNLRLSQINNVLGASKTVYDNNIVTPFEVNEFKPFEDKAAAIGAARGENAKAKNNDENSFISSLMQMKGADSKLNATDSSKTTTTTTPTFNYGTDATSTGGEGNYNTDIPTIA